MLSINSPDDSAVRSAIIKETTVLDPSDAKYVMNRLANFMQDPQKQVAVGDTNIEHIYPQNPSVKMSGAEKRIKKKLEPLTWHIENLTIFGRKANKRVENYEYDITESRII